MSVEFLYTEVMPATSLYRFFDASGLLLYVGISLTPLQRFAQHSLEKNWWDEVDHIKVETYPSREEALARETTAILDDGPKYNIVKPSRSGSAAEALVRSTSEAVRLAIAERDALIRVARSEGHSLREIAQASGLSKDTVATITRTNPGSRR